MTMDLTKRGYFDASRILLFDRKAEESDLSNNLGFCSKSRQFSSCVESPLKEMSLQGRRRLVKKSL